MTSSWTNAAGAVCRCPAAKTRRQCGSVKCCWRCGAAVWAWFRQQISFGSPTSPSLKVPSTSRATRLCRSVTAYGNFSTFYKNSKRVPLFPPSEGFVERALKRGRRPPRVLPSSSSAALPGTTQWQSPANVCPWVPWDYPTRRDPQPGVNTDVSPGAPLQLVDACT